MTKTIRLILIFGFFVFKISAQNSELYRNEEFTVINDLFVQLIDTEYYYNDRLIPLMPDQYLIEYALEPDKHKNDYRWGDKEYYPFEYSKKLIETKGNLEKLKKFKTDFERFSDSITSQHDSRKPFVFVSDSLFQINDTQSKDLKEISRKDSTLSNFIQSDMYLTRYFDYNKISNRGKFDITNERYLDHENRIQKKDIKGIGLIRFSRVVFNSDLTKGFFYFTFFKNRLNAYELLLIVEKVNGKWIIKHEMELWVS